MSVPLTPAQQLLEDLAVLRSDLVSFWVRPDDDVPALAHLEQIWSERERGQGHASRVMSGIMEHADRLGGSCACRSTGWPTIPPMTIPITTRCGSSTPKSSTIANCTTGMPGSGLCPWATFQRRHWPTAPRPWCDPPNLYPHPSRAVPDLSARLAPGEGSPCVVGRVVERDWRPRGARRISL